MRRRFVRDDEGYTMLVVLVSMFLVLGLVMVGLTFAISAVKNSRKSQDTMSALAVAQAGVADFVGRLNDCDDYWSADSTCRTGAANVNNAFTATGAILPGTTGDDTASFRYQVLSDPKSTGLLRLKVTGQTRAETRTVTVDISKTGFLRYLYYTTYETRSPGDTVLSATLRTKSFISWTAGANSTVTYRGTGSAVTASFTKNRKYTLLAPTEQQVKAGCERWYYDANQSIAGPNRDTFARTIVDDLGNTQTIWPQTGDSLPTSTWGATIGSDFSCAHIQFADGDVLSGPVHSQDALYIGGAVTFKDDVTTWWDDPADQFWYGPGSVSLGNSPQRSAKSIDMPKTNTDTQTSAAAGGCVFTGPTEVIYNADGTASVRSPNTLRANLPAYCKSASGAGTKMTSSEKISGGNHVIYVDNASSASGGTCIADYQSIAGDDTTYDNASCTAGDVFVQGTVKGRWTSSAAHNILIVDDIYYSGGQTGDDTLGLVAQNNVNVWHPVDRPDTPNAYVATELKESQIKGMTINAAIAAVAGSFSVLNYDVGSSSLGNLSINGVIVQKYRGTVGATYGTCASKAGCYRTGFIKNYNYDKRLPNLPPPAFLAPENDPWSVTTYAEGLRQ